MGKVVRNFKIDLSDKDAQALETDRMIRAFKKAVKLEGRLDKVKEKEYYRNPKELKIYRNQVKLKNQSLKYTTLKPTQDFDKKKYQK